MLTAATVLAFVVVGYEIAIRCWRNRATVLEIWCLAFLIASTLWISSVWLAALLNQLDRGAMLLRTTAVSVCAIALWLRRRRAEGSSPPLQTTAILLYGLPAIPLLLWVIFVLWRSSVVPPLSHDALAYHLPRAVFFTRLHRFDHLDFATDPRLRSFPANYEMLMSDVLLLEGDDSITEWIGVLFYVAFIVACGALVHRWWRNGPAAYVTMLFTAAVPVLLLHSGADKNDSMVAFFMVAGLVFAGRWISQVDIVALLAGIAAFAAAIGTKPQGAILAVCIAPVMAWRLLREIRHRRLTVRAAASVMALSVGSVLLLGGVTYISNFLHEPPSAVEQGLVPYNDWANLWQAPWVLITAPFSPRPGDLYVPWQPEPWFWQKYELYFSHLGIPFVVCLLCLPGAIVLYRDEEIETGRERIMVTIAAAVAFVLILPPRFVPHGLYATSLPRYLLFVVPVVFGWTLAPAVRRLSSAGSNYVALIFFFASVWFAREAIDYGVNDRFVPLAYVAHASENRGTRSIPFDPWRAAFVADRFAGQDEKIAIDAGFGAWVHPAFGVSLRRPVEFIAPGTGPPRISDDAKWVVIDQSWGVIWAHPEFRDLSQARLYLSKGKTTPEETRVLHYLERDKRFDLIFYNQMRNQAVFRRR